jgi:hypothetical protein
VAGVQRFPVELAEGLTAAEGAARIFSRLPKNDRDTIAEYVAMAPTSVDRRRRARKMLEALTSMSDQEDSARSPRPKIAPEP